MAVLTNTDLVARLAAGESLLLPNAQAARALRFAFDEEQRRRETAAWRAPAIHAWSQFTGSLWTSLVLAGGDERILLNAAQEHLLWKAIVSEAAPGDALTFPDSLADLAARAYRRAADYQATGALQRSATTQDTRTFAAWAATFEKRCVAEAVLPAAQLEAALSASVQQLALPAEVSLAGFGRLTPAQQALVAAMQARGTVVTFHELAAQVEPARCAMLAANPQAELKLAARHIARVARLTPGTRFAILLPDVSADRGELEAALRATLATELNDIESDPGLCPWNFSTGAPLGAQAVTTTAMDVLRLVQEPLPLERISALLLSPYLSPCLGASSPLETAAGIDAELRRRHAALRPEVSLGALAAWRSRVPDSVEHSAISWAANLAVHLQRTEPDLRRALAQPRSYAAWSEFGRDVLRAASWPGTQDPGGLATAARETFDAVLDLLATLDFAGRRVNFRTWLDTLAHQVDQTAVNHFSNAAPVQILSLSESAGMVFDHALLLRATDKNWPASIHPNPLLPYGLQRSLDMPGTDFARDRDAAIADANNLLQRCAQLTITCALEDDQGHLRPSPLLREFSIGSARGEEFTEGREAVPLELTPDDTPLPAPPAYVRGGAKVLQLQAACGFRAFAEIRLQAKELDEASLGLDAAESGNLLHLALQGFWKEVKSRDTLRSMTRVERAAALDMAIAAAVRLRRLQAADDWGTKYLDLQQQRLQTLLLAWLEHEAERGPFHVLETENKQDVTVGPLTLSVRIDRLDRVEDSTGEGVFFVDYKTGSDVRLSQWDGDRPDDPQLPLYALLPEAGELKGLAFARIRPGKDMRWLGHQTEAGILPASRGNAVRDLEMTVEEWRAALTQLAQDFHDGRTDVRPKSVALNCRYCGQRLLCRLDPASLLANETGTDGDAGADGDAGEGSFA